MWQGLIFLVLGLLGLDDSLSPARLAQAEAYGDPVGFGLYVGSLSTILAVAGVVLLVKHRGEFVPLVRRIASGARVSSVRPALSGMIASPAVISFLLLFAYTLLTEWIGYAAATIVFFFVIFRWQGYALSLRMILLTLVVSVGFFGFANFADIPVPMLPEWWG